MAGPNLSRSEIDGKLTNLKTKLDKLRRFYEQYFVGSRERPPHNLRRQVERLVRELERTQISNTSQRFRLRSLIQRFSSYRQKWNRVERQIEEGTYEPHKKRAERRLERKKREEQHQDEDKNREAEEADDGTIELEMNVEEVSLEDFQEELEELDEAGAFEKYVETEKVRRSELDDTGGRSRPAADERSGGDDVDPEQPAHSFQEQPETAQLDPDELERRQRLREKQDELGLSSGRDNLSTRRDKLRQMRDKLEDEKGGSAEPSGSTSSGAAGREPPASNAKERGFDRVAEEPTDQLESLDSKPPDAGADRDEVERLAREHEKKRDDGTNRTRDDRDRSERSDDRDADSPPPDGSEED